MSGAQTQIQPGPYLLPFRELMAGSPLEYEVELAGRKYHVRYRWGALMVYCDPVGFTDEEVVFEQCIGNEWDGFWTDEETTTYLGLLSDALRENRLAALTLPSVEEAPAHPYYRKGPHPCRAVGLVQERPRRLTQAQRRWKVVEVERVVCVPAQDVERWVAEHPEEHAAYRAKYPIAWKADTRRRKPDGTWDLAE